MVKQEGSNQMEPTKRFTGLAEDYASFRPSYPKEVIDYLLHSCSLDSQSRIADIGCGTGIFTRLLAERGLQVTGVEPNAEMRSHAEAEEKKAKIESLSYIDGTAENTTLPTGQSDLVVSAQAFHWFEPEKALQEFNRILKLGGYCALVWNERDETDPFTSAYGKIIRANSDAEKLEVQRGRSGYALLASDQFEDGQVREFMNEQVLSEDGLLGRAYSTSYAPRDGNERELLTRELKKLFKSGKDDNTDSVSLRYVTTVYLARKY